MKWGRGSMATCPTQRPRPIRTRPPSSWCGKDICRSSRRRSMHRQRVKAWGASARWRRQRVRAASRIRRPSVLPSRVACQLRQMWRENPAGRSASISAARSSAARPARAWARPASNVSLFSASSVALRSGTSSGSAADEAPFEVVGEGEQDMRLELARPKLVERPPRRHLVVADESRENRQPGRVRRCPSGWAHRVR